jgi:phosphoglycolate phosphatase
MANKTIIFDFDGTVADTLNILLGIYNQAALRFGCRQIMQEDIEILRSKKPQTFLKQYGVKGYKIPLMALYIKRHMTKHLLEIQPVQGMQTVLAKLKSEDYVLGILTSNSKSNVTNFLDQNNLLDYFDFVYSSKNIFRKDIALVKIANKHKINKKDVIYIGDETRDIEACQRIGIKIIAVSWGFNNKSILKDLNPDAIADTPKDLNTLIKIKLR